MGSCAFNCKLCSLECYFARFAWRRDLMWDTSCVKQCNLPLQRKTQWSAERFSSLSPFTPWKASSQFFYNSTLSVIYFGTYQGGATMWIQVRTIDGKETRTVDDLSRLTKIESLRLKIQEIFHVSPQQQRLFYRGKQVNAVLLHRAMQQSGFWCFSGIWVQERASGPLVC